MWVEFVVGSLLCSERFFSGYSGFPLSGFSIWNVQTRFSEFLRTPKSSVGKQITIYNFFFCVSTAAKLVFQTNPVRFSHVNAFFCSNKFACIAAGQVSKNAGFYSTR